jgi:hypothetical protein
VIYEAIAHQPWSGDAVVEVSIVNWLKGDCDGLKTLWLFARDREAGERLHQQLA